MAEGAQAMAKQQWGAVKRALGNPAELSFTEWAVTVMGAVADYADAYADARVAEEREACALVAETWGYDHANSVRKAHARRVVRRNADEIASRIRQRATPGGA